MKKKILICHPSSELYGADRILAEIIFILKAHFQITLILPQHGDLVEFITTESKQITVEINTDMPIIYRAMFTPTGLIKLLFKMIRFSRFLKKQKDVEVVYINTLAAILVAPIAKLLGKTVVTHVHEIIVRPFVVRRITAMLARFFSDTVICVSAAVRKNLINETKYSTQNFKVLHNGISGFMYKPYDNAGTIRKFCLIGRIMPEKGQWFLLDTLRIMDRSLLKGTHFTLIGGPPPHRKYLFEELQQIIIREGLGEIISLQSFVKDVSSEVMHADVCLVPSIMHDPFPTTVLEAFSAGKPVIATNHGGASEIIENGKEGFLIAPGDTAAFAQALNSFILNPDILHPMSVAARRRFETSLTKEIFEKNIIEIFTHLP